MEVKSYLVLISLFFSQSYAGELKKGFDLKKIKEPHQLMVSHIPKQIEKTLPNLYSLSFVRGHEFYDTPITLKTAKGEEIKYKEQLKTDELYYINSVGETTLVDENVWFFSPDGNDGVLGDISQSCTAEHPCRELTQALIEELQLYLKKMDTTANLWFSTGNYELPKNKREENSSVVFLYKTMSLEGRTTDFRSVAYNEDRAVINGTLSWSDYSNHGGSWSYIQNLKIYTGNNPVLVDDLVRDVNLHSTGQLILINSELRKTKDKDDFRCRSANASANRVYIQDSSLFSQGTSDAVNISSKYADVIRSKLDVSGTDITNVDVSGAANVDKSKLTAHLNTCNLKENYWVANSIRMVNHQNYLLSFTSSNIKITPVKGCPSEGSMLAFNIMPSSLNSLSKLELVDAVVNLENNKNGYGVYGEGLLSIDINNTKIAIASNNLSKESHANAFALEEGEINYTGKPSAIKVSSLSGNAFIYPERMQLIINNASEPLSQCQTNNNEFNC
jgi:hypothetical protein